jgi:hypothetical protein
MKCPYCRLENPPGAETCDCGYSFKTSTRDTTKAAIENPVSERRKNIQIIGLALIVLGLIMAGCFTMFYDTSVPVPKESLETTKTLASPISIPDRVNNFGKIQDRQTGILGGIGISILGALVLLYGKES